MGWKIGRSRVDAGPMDLARASTDASAQAPRPAAPSLRVRLLQLVAAVALPLITLAALAVWRAYDGERLRIGERLTAQARSMAFSLDREFDRVEALLRLLATA